MRALKYLIALWTVLAVYCGFSLFFGAKGFSAYRQLLAEGEKERENMKTLEMINHDLESDKNRLSHDLDTIAVHARQLGYGRENERFIRIVGLGRVQSPQAAAGQVFFAAPPDFVADRTIKIIALCAGFTVLALLFILDMIRQ